MKHVEIEIFPIAKTAVDREAVRRWLDAMGADEFEIPDASAVTDPALLIALSAKRCYKSFQPSLNKNLTRIRKDIAEYLDNVMASGHGSVMECATWTFAIEGCSRVFSAEMNRHRAGVAISEASMRYIRYDNIPYWVPTSIRATVTDPPELAHKKAASRAVFDAAFGAMESHYAELESIWKDELAPESRFHAKKQITSMMRRIIGMGVASGGVWTMNIRAVRHIIALRATPEAEEEICHVFSRIAQIMVQDEPMLMGDFTWSADRLWQPKYRKI